MIGTPAGLECHDDSTVHRPKRKYDLVPDRYLVTFSVCFGEVLRLSSLAEALIFGDPHENPAAGLPSSIEGKMHHVRQTFH